MNVLKKGSRSHKFSVAIVAFFLSLFISLQGQICQLDAAGKAHPTNKENEYPATPEEVVENEHKKQYDCNFPGELYFLEEAKCMADCGIIVNAFAVKKITQSEDKARVMVEFDVVGTFAAGYISEKEDKGNTLTKTRAGECNEFDVFKTTNGKFDYGVIYYDLVRKKGKWKIVPKWKGCPVIYMSISSAIQIIEEDLKYVKDESVKKRNLSIISNLRNLLNEQK